MKRALSERLAEAENLLQRIESWSDEEIEELPKLYREKAREFQDVLANSGEG